MQIKKDNRQQFALHVQTISFFVNSPNSVFYFLVEKVSGPYNLLLRQTISVTLSWHVFLCSMGCMHLISYQITIQKNLKPYRREITVV